MKATQSHHTTNTTSMKARNSNSLIPSFPHFPIPLFSHSRILSFPHSLIPSFRHFLILSFCCLLIYSCSGSDKSQNPIIGKWNSIKPDLGYQYDFDANGKCKWIFTGETGIDSFQLQYAFRDSTSPKEIDIWGFDRGALQGMKMYGIVEFSAGKDSMKFDFEPGDPSIPHRPKDFQSGETVMYGRIKN